MVCRAAEVVSRSGTRAEMAGGGGVLKWCAEAAVACGGGAQNWFVEVVS